MKSELSNQISIPDYWKNYVNSDIDLQTTPTLPCPFHNEKNGKSFSYSAKLGIFSCFGACHVVGGDVVRLHMLNYKISDYKVAENSLARLYHISMKRTPTFVRKVPQIDESVVAYRVAYAEACARAVTVEDWVELDLIMSRYPVEVKDLELFINMRK